MPVGCDKVAEEGGVAGPVDDENAIVGFGDAGEVGEDAEVAPVELGRRFKADERRVGSHFQHPDVRRLNTRERGGLIEPAEADPFRDVSVRRCGVPRAMQHGAVIHL